MLAKISSQSGLTMIELLITTSIVLTLIGISLPVLTKVREQGWLAQSTNNIKHLATANLAYAADHGRFAPSENVRTNNKRWCGGRSGNDQNWDPTQGYLSEYFDNSKEVTPCPMFENMEKSSDSFEEGAGGYGYNSTYIGGRPSWEMEVDGTRVSATLALVERASTTVMFATSGYARADGIQEYPYIEPPFWDFGNGPSQWRPSPTVHFRFNGRALVAWCDGRTSLEEMLKRPEGTNPHGGSATAQNLGWFGPDDDNGYWNPQRRP